MVFRCTCAYRYVCPCLHMKVRGQLWVPTSGTMFLRQGLSLARSPADRLDTESQGSICLCLSSTRITACAYLNLLMWVLRTRLGSLCLRGKHSTSWTISPVPQSSFVSLNVFDKALFFHWMLCSSAIPLPQIKASCSQKSLPDTLLIFLIIILLLSIHPLGRYEAPRMCRYYLGLSTVQANYEQPLTYV